MADYTLKELKVDANDLLLDPRNPRIIEDPSKYICSKKADFSDQWIQEETLAAIQKSKYNVNKLKKSIMLSGFLNIDSIFVKRYGKYSYLVLEGNRRTAAIKDLLQETGLDKNVRESIQRIPVKVLEVKKGADEERIITSILAIRHLDGPLEWEPMQRAFVIFQTYSNILHSEYGESDFSYVSEILPTVSEATKMSKRNIWLSLAVVRIFQHLKQLDLGVTSSHYSIIEKTVSYPKLNTGYFGFDQKLMQFSDSGAEKFANLCLEDSRPINEPKLITKLHKYYNSGRSDIIHKLENRRISLEEADILLKETADTTNFLNTLKAIDKEINKLRPAQYQGSAEEKLLIEAIHQKISEKIRRIIQ